MTSIDEDVKIDEYKSPTLMMAAMAAASIGQNAYFLGQKENHAIKPLEARMNWIMNYGNKVKERTQLNKDYIMQYIEDHRSEIELTGGCLKFTDSQFRYFLSDEIRKDVKIQKVPKFA